MTTKKTAAAARRELLERIQVEGALAGYEAALAVSRDKDAPAPAKATAAGLLLRAAGLLNVKPEDLKPKEPSEMTREELEETIEMFRRPAVDEAEGDGSVFD